jgi:hypothetical protein
MKIIFYTNIFLLLKFESILLLCPDHLLCCGSQNSGIANSIHNNLAKPFTTVCSDPFYGQTSSPRPPKFSQADQKFGIFFSDDASSIWRVAYQLAIFMKGIQSPFKKIAI